MRNWILKVKGDESGKGGKQCLGFIVRIAKEKVLKLSER